MTRSRTATPPDLSRRRFLRSAGAAAGALVVALQLPRTALPGANAARAPTPDFAPNALLRIAGNGQASLLLGFAEMGQDVMTGMATLVAEELGLDPEAIEVRLGDADPALAHPLFGIQITGGSTSMTAAFGPVRQAAADARAALLAAAAEGLGTDPGRLQLRDGRVVHAEESHPIGKFTARANAFHQPGSGTPRPASEFRQIGRRSRSVAATARCTGAARYGIDLRLPGLKFAAVRRCPVPGGTVQHCDLGAAEALPGVVRAGLIHSGVAVVANSSWQAQQAARRLAVEWAMPPGLAGRSSDTLRTELAGVLDGQPGALARRDGAGGDSLPGAAARHAADYFLPYLAHATLEPMNCTAQVGSGHCEVWAPTQAPHFARQVAARLLDLPESSVTVHTTLLGGGFGRRAYSDFVAEAVQAARLVADPVQLLWSREDDIRHDWFRPASALRLAAGLDADGALLAWTAHRAGPSIRAHATREVPGAGVLGPAVFPPAAHDFTSLEGLPPEYAVPNLELRLSDHDPGLPVGFWRSVGHSANAFAKECFMDELAALAGEDPVDFRLRHVPADPRFAAVIRAAARMAGWPRPSAAGRALGFAAHASFGTRVAQVAEVSVAAGRIRVHRVDCAVDCGLAVNPGIVEAQMQGAIVQGLTAALHGEIGYRAGRVAQSGFADYPMLAMADCPEIRVRILPGAHHPSGVGEPGLPPIAPAVANAVYRATGHRLRALPLRLPG